MVRRFTLAPVSAPLTTVLPVVVGLVLAGPVNPVLGPSFVMAQEQSEEAGGGAVATVDDTQPRTPWGAPDLRGVWDYRTMTPLQRPLEFGDKQVLTEEEAAAYERREGARLDDYDSSPSVHAKWWLDNGREMTADKRTSLITSPADGRLPASTADSRLRSEKRATARALTLGVEDRSLTERCLTFGIPSLPRAYNSNLQILQTPTTVALVSEMIHDARVVPLDGRAHVRDQLRQWHGDARGHWDGDTLVVETTNFSGHGNFRGSTESLRLVERFTRLDASTINYVLTVDDPGTWEAPWTVMVPFAKSDQALFEYACHEGNRGLRNILSNARFAENTGATK